MIATSGEIVYLGFILPTLFSLTLLGEGIYKVIKGENGYLIITLGGLFLIGIIIGYINIFLN